MADRDQMTFIETDIDCFQCLDDVRRAVAGTPWVEDVEVDASAGCLVVHHHGSSEKLSELVAAFGHQLGAGINGEVMMDRASVALPMACPVGHDAPHGEPR